MFESKERRGDVERISDVAVEACRSLGVAGLCRVDLRLDAWHQSWVLEVNTIPGLTDHSLVPKAAAHAGIGFAELCERSIQSCLSTRPQRPHLLHNAFARRKVS